MEIQHIDKKISVIIPYYNEADTIMNTLDIVAQQTLSPQEVLLVNSSSTDNSFTIIEDWIQKNGNKYKTEFRNIQEGTTVPSSSKNVGIRNARCDILAFMDCGLLFERDWLEKQMDFILSYGVDIVSGVCYFEGETLLDKSAIAQTYGYRQFRPTIPSSLVKKSVFEKIGLFKEDRRAGYDVDWINRLTSKNITRGVNQDVVIRYSGINYGDSLKGIFLKNIRYSIPTVGLYKYYYPYYYLLLGTLSAGFFFVYGAKVMLSLVAYIVIRGYIIPTYKSGGISLFREEPLTLLTMPLVSLVTDTGKLIGYIRGIAKQFYGLLKSFF